MNYNNKVFKVVSNSQNGETSSETRFTYQQKGELLTAWYSGGNIEHGQCLGIVSKEGNIAMRYQHLTKDKVLMTGKCNSKPEILPSGKIRLHEVWEWTSGDQSKGTSILEEINYGD